MKIIGLKTYQKGYTGCIEHADKYVLFRFAHHTYKPIQEYSIDAYQNRDHFISSMGKFIRPSFFLKEPVEITSITQESLNRCHVIMESYM
jgi:hypothetical protein